MSHGNQEEYWSYVLTCMHRTTDHEEEYFKGKANLKEYIKQQLAGQAGEHILEKYPFEERELGRERGKEYRITLAVLPMHKYQELHMAMRELEWIKDGKRQKTSE